MHEYMYILTYMHVCIYIYMHVYIYTCVYTHTYIYIMHMEHVYMHIYLYKQALVPLLEIAEDLLCPLDCRRRPRGRNVAQQDVLVKSTVGLLSIGVLVTVRSGSTICRMTALLALFGCVGPLCCLLSESTYIGLLLLRVGPHDFSASAA